MSFTTDSCRGSPQIFSASMGKNNIRPMGSVHHKRRLQTRVSSKTSIFRHCLHKYSKERRKYCFRGGNFSFGKRRYRKSTYRTNSSRFLQYLISSCQEKRQNETCYKLETSQSIPVQETFQDGYTHESDKFSKTKRLGCLNRSERCISAHTNFSGSQKISEVLFPRPMLPVEGDVFRANCSSTSFYQNSNSSGCLFTNSKCSSSSVSRRLAEFEPGQRNSCTKPRSKSKSADNFGVYSKFRKVKFDTSTNFCVHRSLVQYQTSVGTPNPRKVGKTATGHLGIDKWTDKSIRFSQTSRFDRLLHTTNPKCTPVHETNSVAPTELLETFKTPFEHRNSIYSTSKITLGMVAKFSQHYERPITLPIIGRNDSHHRCFNVHVRGSFGEQLCAGDLVKRTDKTTYQSVRNESGSFMPETFFTQNTREDCIGENRQHNSSAIHKQTGRHKIDQTVHRDLGPLAICYSKPGLFEGSSFARRPKLSCRPIKSSQNQSNRMDFRQNCCSDNISQMGQSNDGPFCISSKSSDPSFLLMATEQTSICDRCSEHFLGEHVCLCLSPNLPHSKDSETYTAVPLSDHSHSSTVAEETVVSRPVGTSGSSSSQTPSHSESADSAKHTNSSPKPRNIQSNSLVVVDKRFQEIGFSQGSRKLLMAAWRSGTQKDYANKFRLYDSWCSAREIDSYCATIVHIADFVSHLYHKGLQYSTINGYRSMLSAVLPCIDGHKVGQHPYVIQLLKGVFNSRPPQVKLVPEWDLLKVLEAVQKKPFEPIHKASLKLVTLKTVFMIAITSFRRCSDLQSFRIGQDSVNIQSKGITFIRHGLAKQDRQSHRKATVFIPAFPENKKLDPRRCLYHYLKATEGFRKSPDGKDETKVFLGLNEPHKPVCAQTISNWIVETLRLTLKDRNLKVKAHSTRALGPSLALFRGASVESIMNSADWSSESTFVRSYLRDLNCNVLKTKQ